MEDKKPWYKRGWVITGLALSVVTLFGLGLFVRQTYIYMGQISKPWIPTPANSKTSTKQDQTNLLAQAQQAKIADMVKGRPGDPFAGPATATKQVVEFLDFDCPVCQQAAPQVLNLISKHPDIKFVIRDYPITDLHPDAMNAAKSARCVWNQGNPANYWRFYQLLFSTQGQHNVDSLRQNALLVGADPTAYDQCLSSNLVESSINQSILDAENVNIQGTPTFFVDGLRQEGTVSLPN